EYVTINLSNFDTGYAFSYLKVNGEFVKPYGYNGYLSATFTMPHNNVAIEVGTTSVSGKYYIDTSYDSTLGGVEVWVNNNYVGNDWHQGSWANYGDTVSFKVKPYYSDDVVSVSVVGKRTGWTYSCDYNSYSGWYTFTMLNEDVTINVDFRSGVHKVYVDKVTDGKLTVSDDWAKYGQIVYITAVPDYGCTLSSLSVRTATGDSVHVYNAQKADTYYFYMPDQYVSVSAVFTGKYTSLPFNDVSYGDWYYNAVQFVYSKGIMDGVDYYKFAPNGTITRGMILTMLWRMAGEPFEMPVTSFTDVEIGRYYTTAVAWACRNGIADGMGESAFGPNDAITREELVTLLYRYAQYFGHSCIGTSIEGFADAGSVSSYAYNAMCWAYKAGVVTGTTGSRLNPQGTASRAEAAQMIMSFYSFLNS
uniref:S-layer homology domain-containing protein n=1 Tax=Candidatus Scatomorpha intestinigallinarum TaxID=2840923 RepID=UPI00402A09B3